MKKCEGGSCKWCTSCKKRPTCCWNVPCKTWKPKACRCSEYQEKEYFLIGSYTPAKGEAEAVIERGATEQGYVFKDERAFEKFKKKICYIPELHDGGYTRQDFVDMCNGREDFARELFYYVDWQSPETLLEEWFVNGEWDECEKCGWFHSLHPKPAACEKCGAEFKAEVDGE